MSSESASNDGKDRSGRAWVAETVRRIQRGDAVEAHFELLFREYEPAVRRKLRYRGWLGADLDDLVQDVMIRVYRGLGRFRFDSSFDTWILQIMSNAAKNAARDRNTGKARATRASLEGLLEDGDSGPAMAEPEGRWTAPSPPSARHAWRRPWTSCPRACASACCSATRATDTGKSPTPRG